MIRAFLAFPAFQPWMSAAPSARELQLMALLAGIIAGVLLWSAAFLLLDLVERTLGAVRLRIKVNKVKRELDVVVADEVTERRRRRALDAIARSR